MQQAIEEMAADRGKGALGTAGFGCFWIPKFPLELFFCFDKGEPGSAPYLYHYLWGSVKEGENRWQKVESITRESKTRNVTAKLKKGSQKPLKGTTSILMNWVSKWQGSSPFSPDNHCVITQVQEENYVVTCTHPSGESNGKWTSEKVSKNQIVDTNNSELKRVTEQ